MPIECEHQQLDITDNPNDHVYCDDCDMEFCVEGTREEKKEMLRHQGVLRDWNIAVYPTIGPRSKKHKIVLYFAPEFDWPSYSMERNGNKIGSRLIILRPTRQAAEDYAGRKRAHSIQYQTWETLEKDLETLGYDRETIDQCRTVTRVAFQ